MDHKHAMFLNIQRDSGSLPTMWPGPPGEDLYSGKSIMNFENYNAR